MEVGVGGKSEPLEVFLPGTSAHLPATPQRDKCASSCVAWRLRVLE